MSQPPTRRLTPSPRGVSPDTNRPDLTGAGGGSLVAVLGLAVLAVLVAHLVTVPGAVAMLAGFVAVLVVPVVGLYGVFRAGLRLLTAFDRSRVGERRTTRSRAARSRPREAD